MADEDDLFHVTHAQKVSALYTVAALGIPIQCRTAADAKLEEKMIKNADAGKQLKQPLELVWKNHSERLGQLQVPRILVAAAAVIETDLDTEGLFRVPGSSKRATEINDAVDSGREVKGTSSDMSTLIKAFLREMPEPLLTTRLFDSFVHAAALPSLRDRVRAIKLLVLELPTSHLHVLIFLMSLLGSVVAHGTVNRMNASNLASMIAPNILRPAKSKSTDPAQQAADMLKFHGETCRAVTLLILHHAELGVVPDDVEKMAEEFSGDSEEAKLIYQQLLEAPSSTWFPKKDGGAQAEGSESQTSEAAKKHNTRAASELRRYTTQSLKQKAAAKKPSGGDE